jgi:hypothetical protein
VQALIKENQQLREQVRDLERNWKKLEKALSVNVRRAKRTVRRRGRAVTKSINEAIDRATT